jgi:hypothetical protein
MDIMARQFRIGYFPFKNFFVQIIVRAIKIALSFLIY